MYKLPERGGGGGGGGNLGNARKKTFFFSGGVPLGASWKFSFVQMSNKSGKVIGVDGVSFS